MSGTPPPCRNGIIALSCVGKILTGHRTHPNASPGLVVCPRTDQESSLDPVARIEKPFSTILPTFRQVKKDPAKAGSNNRD